MLNTRCAPRSCGGLRSSEPLTRTCIHVLVVVCPRVRVRWIQWRDGYVVVTVYGLGVINAGVSEMGGWEVVKIDDTSRTV